MGFLKNTLNFASYSYNAATNTPALANMKDGTVFEVATAGKVIGTAIDGATVGADSYLLVGDKVVYKNGGYELLSREVKDGTTINVGTGGLFTTLKLANDYVSQRMYTEVVLNLLSATVETASIDVQNPCGGRLVIMGNGFTIDFSATANTNCTLSGNNIYIDDFKVKANIGTNKSALVINGNITHDNLISIQNISATGRGLFYTGNIKSKTFDAYGSIPVTANINILVNTPTSWAITGAEPTASLECNNITTNGSIKLAGNNIITGAIDTGGGQFHGGSSSSNSITGAIDTGGGQFNCGDSCSNYITGAITTGGGQFNCGLSTANVFVSTITTGNGLFSCGGVTNNRFGGLVSIGTGLLIYGSSTTNQWFAGAAGTGGVNAGGGSVNHCNGQPMPAGTPATGTNTAAFSRVN